MNAVHDPEPRIAAFLDEGIEVLPDWVLDAVQDEIDTTQQRRAWRRAWRIPTVSYALRLGLVLTVVFLGLGFALITRPDVGSSPPPRPSPATWSGPLRAGAGDMPVLTMAEVEESGGWTSSGWSMPDQRDAAVPGVDIVDVRWSPDGQLYWWIELAGRPPRAENLDPAETIIEYGVVLDTNRDRVADYQFGINNDAPVPGDFRIWITDLATGETDEQVGAPYGHPVEFSHPDEQANDSINGEARPPTMVFTFLGGGPRGARLVGPPDEAGEVRPSNEWQFYVWATVTERGEVVAWDYGPDSGWLTVPSP
jgi:hypothetical protein